MPHQCVRCNIFYEDGNEAILKGCSCGGKLFFFIKKEKYEKAKQAIQVDLKPEEKQQIEHDVLEMIGTPDPEVPVILDFESVRVVKPGKYEVDLVHLFKGEPVIFKLDEGKYVIDLAETFERMKKKGN